MRPDQEEKESILRAAVGRIFGGPKDLRDRLIFRRLTLIPLLAWIGLGADGLSSSSYGPAEAFKALGDHTYLALLLAPPGSASKRRSNQVFRPCVSSPSSVRKKCLDSLDWGCGLAHPASSTSSMKNI